MREEAAKAIALNVSMPHAALLVVQVQNHGKEHGEDLEVSMPHAALFVVQVLLVPLLGNILIVSMPHAALFVVQADIYDVVINHASGFNAARGFVCGARAYVIDVSAN